MKDGRHTSSLSFSGIFRVPNSPVATADLSDALKRVLRYMPAPVGIVTSYTPETGEPVGLAMSALMPVALDPCSMAVAVNRSGASHEIMLRAGAFCINLLDPASGDHLTPFAGPAARDQRFTGPDWQQHGPIWYLGTAPAAIICTLRHVVSHGTHDVLIGDVDNLIVSDSTEILGWGNGGLGLLAPLSKA